MRHARRPAAVAEWKAGAAVKWKLALLTALMTTVGLYITEGGAAIAEAPPAQMQQPTTAREQFAIDLLGALGNSAPTPDTVAMIVEWTLAEDAGDGAMLRNNPLNTTQTSAAVTQTINGDGVRGYASYQDGLAATIQTLSYGYYDGIVYALQTNDAEGARQALWASPWAESHYGYGASWPRVR